MGKKSKIDRLPDSVRDEIARLRAGGHTIDEIMAHLRRMPLAGEDLPGRSGLGEHIQKLDRLAEMVQLGRKVAEAIVPKLGEGAESRQTRLNVELMHGITTKLLMAKLAEADDGEVSLTAQEAMFLGRTIKDLAAAAGLDAKTTLALRELEAGKDEAGEEAEAEAALPESPR